MSEGLSVCRREVKVVHFELFSVHRDDVSLRVSGSGLLVKHLNLPFDNLVSSVAIGSDQTVNVFKNMRKILNRRTKTLTPPTRHAIPMRSRKPVSCKTPLLFLLISKTVTNSDTAKIFIAAQAIKRRS
jgi:hypothetical protein